MATSQTQVGPERLFDLVDGERVVQKVAGATRRAVRVGTGIPRCH